MTTSQKQSAFFCLSTKTGTYLIATQHFYVILTSLYLWIPLEVTMHIFCCFTFIMMVFRDGKFWRAMYLSTYCVYCVLVGLMTFVRVLRATEETAGVMIFVPLVSLMVSMLTEAYFVTVIWRHYKNSDMTRSKGGC